MIQFPDSWYHSFFLSSSRLLFLLLFNRRGGKKESVEENDEISIRWAWSRNLKYLLNLHFKVTPFPFSLSLYLLQHSLALPSNSTTLSLFSRMQMKFKRYSIIAIFLAHILKFSTTNIFWFHTGIYRIGNISVLIRKKSSLIFFFDITTNWPHLPETRYFVPILAFSYKFLCLNKNWVDNSSQDAILSKIGYFFLPPFTHPSFSLIYIYSSKCAVLTDITKKL